MAPVAVPVGVSSSVHRTMDPLFLNMVANHPAVRPTLGGDGPIDLTAILADPDNRAYETGNGGLVCQHLGTGRYDVHTLFLPEGRGAEAYQAMRETADDLFAATDCVEILTTVPCLNRAAAVAARRLCFEVRFAGQIPWAGGARAEAEFFGLSLSRWALRCPRAHELGHWFHAQLFAAKAARGSTAPVHDDDPVHDQMVGAAVLLVLAGQPDKAINLYNVWAQCAHYAPITLLRRHPIIVDVHDAVIEARATTMEVLLCR
jgi:hypothetical protein